jgi:hypothetical protein
MAQLVQYAFFDPPQVLDCSVTPIPAASSPPLQVIANSGPNDGVGVSFQDTTGTFIGVYVGASGHEELLCIIGNGASKDAWAKILPHMRISIRAMANVAITVGLLQAALVTEW